MSYIICTGYYGEQGSDKEKFYDTWYRNTMTHAKPERVIVLANGGSRIGEAPGQWINLGGNLGHTHDLTEHRKPHAMCGWSCGFVALAMIAYMDECDFIFKEQDCLAFGPWVEQLYSEIGERGMLFGHSRVMACAQSLCLIKHAFIPEFVKLYMSQGNEQERSNECELKFARLEKSFPFWFGRFSFGVDRDRPMPVTEPVWYGQQFTQEELAELKNLKLI